MLNGSRVNLFGMNTTFKIAMIIETVMELLLKEGGKRAEENARVPLTIPFESIHFFCAVVL